MFVGNYTHNIDTKGRVFVPSKLRQELGQRFYICRSIDCQCIRAYNLTEWENMLTKLRDSNLEDNMARRRLAFSAVEVEMDSQGRIMLAEQLRKFAGLTDKVCIVGMLDWVEFWNPDLFDQLMGDGLTGPDMGEYETLRSAGIN